MTADRRAALITAMNQAYWKADRGDRMGAVLDLIRAETLEEMEALRRKVMTLEMERHAFLANEEEYQNQLAWLRAETLEEAARVVEDPSVTRNAAGHAAAIRALKGGA